MHAYTNTRTRTHTQHIRDACSGIRARCIRAHTQCAGAQALCACEFASRAEIAACRPRATQKKTHTKTTIDEAHKNNKHARTHTRAQTHTHTRTRKDVQTCTQKTHTYTHPHAQTKTIHLILLCFGLLCLLTFHQSNHLLSQRDKEHTQKHQPMQMSQPGSFCIELRSLLLRTCLLRIVYTLLPLAVCKRMHNTHEHTHTRMSRNRHTHTETHTHTYKHIRSAGGSSWATRAYCCICC